MRKATDLYEKYPPDLIEKDVQQMIIKESVLFIFYISILNINLFIYFVQKTTKAR